MKRRGTWCAVGVVLAMLFAPPADSAAPAAPAAGGPPKVKTVTFQVFHRVFQNFRDRVTVPMRQDFRIGDSEYTGRVIEWVPDFTMDLKTRKVVSRGNEPKNPAFRIIVRKAGVPRDTVWAFFNMPPHYTPKSQIGFMATEIQFLDRKPLASPDSTAPRELEPKKEPVK
jgi:hypothetical protein